MRKLIVFGFFTMLFASCQEKAEKRYTQQSPEIDTFKTVLGNYDNKEYEAMVSHYADTAKTYFNTSDKPIALGDLASYHSQNDANYSNRGFLKEDQEYEMVVTDKGDTWVNFWGDWKGTLNANGKEITIPIHLTSQFKDGKIVRSSGNWDTAPLVLAIQEIEAMKNEPEIAQKINESHQAFIDFWNSHNMDDLSAIVVSNVVRLTNGRKELEGQEEYIAFVDTFFTAFPDLHFTVEDSYAHGGKTYHYWTALGKNTGKFGENEPTGKSVKTHGHTILTYNAEGKIIKDESYYDQLDMFEQLGYSLGPPK